MATAGPNYATVGADDSGVGTLTWGNPTYGVANDGEVGYVTKVAETPPSYSHYLKGTGFGFSIPTNATINGVTLAISRKRSSLGTPYCYDYIVSLIKGGTISGDNKADTSTNWPTASTDKTYGGSADMWGLSLSPSDINASNFGATLSCRLVPGTSQSYAYSNYFKITVTYTEAATGYTHSVTGVVAASISAVDGVATASISTVQGA